MDEEFDPQAFVDLPVIPDDTLRPTTYGPGSPNPTPADMREFTGNAENPLQAGDVALQPDTAAKYGLKSGDQFMYQGQVYRYADTPNQRVGDVIDIYHPAEETATSFDPNAFVKSGSVQPWTEQTVKIDTGRDTEIQGGFDPQAFLAGVPPEASQLPDQKEGVAISIPSFAPTPVPQVSVNVPSVPVPPMPIQRAPVPTVGVRPILAPQGAGQVAGNALRAAGDIASGTVRGITQFPETAWQMAKLRFGTQDQQGQAIATLLSQASAQGQSLVQGLQSPVGSRPWFNSIGQVAMAAAPLAKVLRTTEFAGVPPFEGRVNIGEALSEESSGGVKGSGRYHAVYPVNKEAGDLMNKLAASQESASLRAHVQHQNVMGDLAPEEMDALGKYLVSERLKTVNPEHPQILSPQDAERISSNPHIAPAISRYAKLVKPEIESLRKEAGLSESAAAGKSSEFISLMPEIDEPIEARASAGPMKFKSKTTQFAKTAEGFAKKYNTNLKDILDASYREVMRKARLRELYASLKKNGLVSEEPVSEIKGQTAVPVAIGHASGGSSALPEVAFMPVQIADALRDVMERPPNITSPLLKTLQLLQRGITGTALTANPPELLNHMRRQMDIVASMPAANLPLPVRALTAILPYFGPRLGIAIKSLTENVSTTLNRALLQDIFDANAGSSRAFKEYQARGWLSRTTGLSKLQQATQKLLFGVPNGRGIKGWDLRMRIQMEKIRRAYEGNTDPQRIREFSNQIGQYTTKPDKFVEVMKHINPYSATTLPLRLTELKQLLGGSGLKARSGSAAVALRAETLLRGAGGTLIALTAANKMLSGKWPWENDPGHELDLNTGMHNSKGKTIYATTRVIAPTLSRPINTLSVPELARERTATKPSYSAAAAVGPANQVASILSSPLSNVALTAATGYVPYLTKQPGRPAAPYDVAAHGPTNDRGLNQLIAAAENVNPVGQGIATNQNLPTPLNYMERPVLGVRPLGTVFTSSYEKGKSRGRTRTVNQRSANTRAAHIRSIK